MNTKAEKIFFDSIKEDRGWYFVEYSPPIPSFRFATLQLVTPDEVKKEDIALAMEVEIKLWLARYPIPLMVSAFDAKGDLYDFAGIRESNHLMGFLGEDSNELRSYWHLLKDEELPDHALDQAYLKAAYSDVGFRTSEDLRQKSEKYHRTLRIGWFVVFVWAVIVPAMVAILEWSSDWLSLVVLAYSLWKALVKALQLTGKCKKSPKEIEQEQETLRMRHHHYHCEQNPDGFMRLKMENFEKEERERIQKEMEAIRQKGRSQ